jgi:hypothetical protein
MHPSSMIKGPASLYHMLRINIMDDLHNESRHCWIYHSQAIPRQVTHIRADCVAQPRLDNCFVPEAGPCDSAAGGRYSLQTNLCTHSQTLRQFVKAIAVGSKAPSGMVPRVTHLVGNGASWSSTRPLDIQCIDSQRDASPQGYGSVLKAPRAAYSIRLSRRSCLPGGISRCLLPSYIHQG